MGFLFDTVTPTPTTPSNPQQADSTRVATTETSTAPVATPPATTQVCSTCNQVVVQFRPHSAYEGEFGFDWLRIGDTAMYGDALPYADFSTTVPVYNMLGKYYRFKNVSTSGVESFSIPLTGRNGWKNCKDLTTGVTKTKAQCHANETESVYFKESPDMYTHLINESYKTMSLAWKVALEPTFKYYVPLVTLIPDEEIDNGDGTISIVQGNSAKLAVHIEVIIASSHIKLKPTRENTGVEFKIDGVVGDNLTLQAGVHDAHLEVRCTQPLTSNLDIDVYADDNLCGRFTLLKNDSSVVVKKKILLIEVKSDFDISYPQTGTPKHEGKESLNNCLKQALINADIELHTEVLDITHVKTRGRHEFRNQFAERVGSKYVIKKNLGSLLGYLNTQFTNQFPHESYDYRVYFLGENGTLNGFARSSEKAGVYFPTHTKSTIAHELFHAMGLRHTFTNSEADRNAKYTYKATMTNNLMDYSHLVYEERMLTFYWQWKILNSRIPNV
jgi:hypothetical protein